jgi:hypothetical protein
MTTKNIISPIKVTTLTDYIKNQAPNGLVNNIINGGLGYTAIALAMKSRMMFAGGNPPYSGAIRGYVKEDFSDVKNFIDSLGGKLLSSDLIDDIENFETIENIDNIITRTEYIFDHGVICVQYDIYDKGVDINYSSSDEEFIKKLFVFAKENLTFEISVESSVYVIAVKNKKLSLSDIGDASLKLKRENYTDDVLEKFDALVTDLNSKVPTGRLSLFRGPAGTGKTFLVRGLLKEVKNSIFVIVPSGLLPQLGSPDMLPVLIEAKRFGSDDYSVTLLLEDADMLLAKRMADNMNAIHSLLNFSDGILGRLLDLRIVATTNADKIEIDKAAMRPGRLNCEIEVGLLSWNKTKEILDKLCGKEGYNVDVAFEKLIKAKTRGACAADKPVVSLAEVYREARKFGWEPEDIDKLGVEDAKTMTARLVRKHNEELTKTVAGKTLRQLKAVPIN